MYAEQKQDLVFCNTGLQRSPVPIADQLCSMRNLWCDKASISDIRLLTVSPFHSICNSYNNVMLYKAQNQCSLSLPLLLSYCSVRVMPRELGLCFFRFSLHRLTVWFSCCSDIPLPHTVKSLSEVATEKQKQKKGSCVPPFYVVTLDSLLHHQDSSWFYIQKSKLIVCVCANEIFYETFMLTHFL